MQPKQISSWITSKEFHNESIGTHVKSWLTETGPITNRIKSNGTFKLELIKDEVGTVKRIDANFLGEDLGEIKIREVLLLSNNKPKVFARSLIPNRTIEKGLSELGELGSKPLGDILFEKEIFKKIETVFAKFSESGNLYWGRKSKYLVKVYPLSVMEVFLLPINE